jgi:pSer/pThr/pTyr-binding forkhead associated (FHA) protein
MSKQRIAALVSSNGFPTIKVDPGMILVGRSPDCDVVVDSKKISRKHCCVALVKDRIHVRDLGSTNGCWWQGERHDDFTVQEGQEFAIADASYRFFWDQPSDNIVMPSSRDTSAADDRPSVPRTYPETNSRLSPESSDPFLPLAGLA